ncbi:MAG: MarR family transcriptional regulator, partial [Lactiplantibacillus plantarum]|nr:MarR family transcriptional regulator [Lactiplantibacillus plantarum]
MQISTINFIANNEQHHDLFQRDLELEFNIRKATCSSLVSKMEAADLLIRVPAKDDGRYKRLLLTPKARQLATKIERFFETSEQRMATILGVNTAETYEALRQIAVAFSTPTHAPENWY